jgi:hypothetical protein
VTPTKPGDEVEQAAKLKAALVAAENLCEGIEFHRNSHVCSNKRCGHMECAANKTLRLVRAALKALEAK